MILKGGTIMKRSIFAVGLFFFVYGLGVGTSTIQAQPYPNRPIQLVIPNVSGSIMDINSRVVSDELGKILGTQIVVVNKPGAATTLGSDAVARSKKDGYTLGYLSTSSLIFARILNPETVPYDPFKDFEPQVHL
jgi:tripartite-type tricarboxylate transporter receptor subunit TctC